MRKLFALAICLLTALVVSAQTNSAAVRLAIVPEMPEAGATADLLTAELSQNNRVLLLERAEVERVYREQGLSAANGDYLKLGQVLGADGLLLLETGSLGTNQFLSVELVAVKPGVLLSGERFGWPIKDPAAWASTVGKHLSPLFPKLDVLAKDAIPVSIVNLRSAIQSTASREAERQLTLLAIERLSREKQLFVLERRRMQLLSEEKELKGLDDSAFWNGSYLLDGTLDSGGYSPDVITINARLVPPKGAPIPIEVSGSRTNFAEVLNRLADKVLASLELGQSPAPWNAADEASQFYEEAQWAMKWELYPQAQAAAESAWALGKKDPDTAILLLRSYAESVPDEGFNMNELRVQQVPDSSEFAPLGRGLEVLLQNMPVLFAGSNSSVESYKLGLRLLRSSAGLMEGYYYAAEMRADHAEELSALREKMQHTMKALDAHPLTTNTFAPWNDPRSLYSNLKWEEGGICFEHPEDAFPFYRDLLNAGAHPAHLPRIVGWSWPDRQRAPGLIRRLIGDARGSTNVTVRLEGLYLALLLAPDDDQGSLRHAEEGLESAMWENRAVLLSSPENASLVERTRQALCDKDDYHDIYHAFSHEPFASFKHRLLMDFLQSSTNTDFAVLDELFPNTNVKMETPEQAKELLPLMEAQRQRSPSWSLDFKLVQLRRNASVAPPSQVTAPKPSVAAEEPLDARFVPWNLSRPGIDAGRAPRFYGMIIRDGQLWLRVRYAYKNYAYPSYGSSRNAQTTYLAVDPQRGVREEILFPDTLGVADDLFEVSSNALFVEAEGHLYMFKFHENNWEELSVPMEGARQLVWLGNRLFIGRNDGLLTVQPDSRKIELLVSARRTPAANEIDPLWTSDTKIFPQAGRHLGALARDYCFTFDPGTRHWSVRPLPLTGTNQYFTLTADYISSGGAQRLLTGPFARRYLIGFWNDDRTAESLLMEETGIPVQPPAAEKLLPPLKWDWPKNYPMEHSQITAEGKNLWVLAPRKTWQSFIGEEPIQFSDNRLATLFCFTPDSRQPLSLAVRLPDTDLGERLRVNGRPVEILEPRAFGFPGGIMERLGRHVGNSAFWLWTPEGLVLGGPNYCGHWLIPKTTLESKFKAQRQKFGQQSDRKDAVLRNPSQL